MSWERVTEAVKAMNGAYYAWVKAKTEEREGGKKYNAALALWLSAHEERRQALLDAWNADKDGYRLDDATLPALGRTLQRYYSETVVPKEVKR